MVLFRISFDKPVPRARSTWFLVAMAPMVALAITAGALQAQAQPGASGGATRYASATLHDSTGTVVGTVQLKEGPNDPVRLRVDVQGLKPGKHGIHIHAVGKCDTGGGVAAFTSAGGHFNPESKHHGLENPEGPHAGDLHNLHVNAAGAASIRLESKRVTLGPGANSLLDEDGSAIVIHASEDDQKSDPAGNAGARVACGVISESGPPPKK